MYLIIQAPDGMSSLEKLDFWLHLPCSSFMIGEMSSPNLLTDLLGGGTLVHRQNISLEADTSDFALVRVKPSAPGP